MAADPRFFPAAEPLTLAALAALTGAAVGGAARGDRPLAGVAPLETAGPDDLSFLANRLYADQLTASRAGAVIVHPDHVGRAPATAALLITTQPYLAFARAARALHPDPRPVPGVAPSAVIAADVQLGEGVAIGPHVVIESGVRIGAGSAIGPNTTIAAGVEIGRDCRIGANVTLSHCLIGHRVVIHPGVRIGQPGFGFAPNPPAGHVRIPQLGRVIIGDDADIGANCTIDRGAGPDTVIEAAVMLDNLVQIGHNAVIGHGSVIVSQSGVSGSTRLGPFVSVGGQTGIAGHLTVGAGAQVAGGSGVMRDVPAGGKVGGTPAVPILQWHRQTASLERLARDHSSRRQAQKDR